MSLIATLAQPLISEYEGKLDKNEHRASSYGAIQFFIDQTNLNDGLLSPGVKENIANSFGNTVLVPVINNDKVTIGNKRMCTAPINESTSGLVALNFATFAWGFTMYPGQYGSNQIDYGNDFRRKFSRYERELCANLDQYACNLLDTEKNVIWNLDTLDQYPQSGDALQVPPAGQGTYYNYLSAIMRTMDWQGDYNIIANTMHLPEVRHYQNQGLANNTNLNYQFGEYKYHFTNRMVNTGATVKSTTFCVPDGQVAFSTRLDPDSLMGARATSGAEWGKILLPTLGLECGTLYKSDCADVHGLLSAESNPANTGLTASLAEMFMFSLDVCFVTAYNSEKLRRSQPIIKAEFIK